MIFCFHTHTGMGIYIPIGVWVFQEKNERLPNLPEKGINPLSHSNHVGKPLNRLGEARDRLFRVSVFKSVPDTMADVPLQYDLPHLMQGGLGGIELSKNIFTGNVFVNHPVDCLHLSDNLLEAAMQIFGIHALFHGGVS